MYWPTVPSEIFLWWPSTKFFYVLADQTIIYNILANKTYVGVCQYISDTGRPNFMYWHSGMFYTGTTYHTYWQSDFITLALVNVHTGISSGRFQFVLGNHSLLTGTHWQPVSKCTGMRERGHRVGQQTAQDCLFRASPTRCHSGGVGTIASRLTLRCPVCACTARTLDTKVVLKGSIVWPGISSHVIS